MVVVRALLRTCIDLHPPMGAAAHAAYNWQVPSDRHDVRSLDVARLAHFTHCGKPPAKVNGRYDACALLHREWRETWARVAAESGVVA